MAVTPTKLRDRFRSEVDDVLPDAADDSAALWTDAEILVYLNEALLRFVHGTRYFVGRVELAVIADEPSVPLPHTVIEIRDEVGYLQTRGAEVREMAYSEFNSAVSDDYGFAVTGGRSPFTTQASGRPRYFSTDIDANELLLFPPSDADDTLVLSAYVEAEELGGFDDALPIQNPRHAYMLLDGMKMLAYGKQDAEVYDPAQEARYRTNFEASIASVYGERARRRRQPQVMPYGGL